MTPNFKQVFGKAFGDVRTALDREKWHSTRCGLHPLKLRKTLVCKYPGTKAGWLEEACRAAGSRGLLIYLSDGRLYLGEEILVE